MRLSPHPPSSTTPQRRPARAAKLPEALGQARSYALAKLRPAFRETGTITAGNAPGLNSGAAAMVVADRAFAEGRSLQPMARLVAYGVAAVEPAMFGLGPVPAVRKALERVGWKLADIERIEINEAFAAVPLAVAQELGPLEIGIKLAEKIAACGPLGINTTLASAHLAISRTGSRNQCILHPHILGGTCC